MDGLAPDFSSGRSKNWKEKIVHFQHSARDEKYRKSHFLLLLEVAVRSGNATIVEIREQNGRIFQNFVKFFDQHTRDVGKCGLGKKSIYSNRVPFLKYILKRIQSDLLRVAETRSRKIGRDGAEITLVLFGAI